MVRAFGALFAAVIAAGALTACSGSSSSAAPPVTTFSPPTCPSASGPATTKWPAGTPKDIPLPKQATIQKQGTTVTADGVHIVRFTTPTSLRTGVLFIVDKLPKAGYVLGRGDAETNEADAPFVHGNVRGLMRLLALQPCQTLWLLATVSVQSTNTSPLLPTHSPSGSPSPLPFG